MATTLDTIALLDRAMALSARSRFRTDDDMMLESEQAQFEADAYRLRCELVMDIERSHERVKGTRAVVTIYEKSTDDEVKGPIILDPRNVTIESLALVTSSVDRARGAK